MTGDEASSETREIRRIVGLSATELQVLGDIAWEAECVALAVDLDLEADRRLRGYFHVSGSFLGPVPTGPSAPLPPDNPGADHPLTGAEDA